jgi:hypothetical protein
MVKICRASSTYRAFGIESTHRLNIKIHFPKATYISKFDCISWLSKGTSLHIRPLKHKEIANFKCWCSVFFFKESTIGVTNLV